MTATPPELPPTFGTPGAAGSRRMLLLGSGELGREVVIEAMRLGIEVIACDRYAGAPAMQFAHRSHVFDMLDGAQVRRVIELERPHYIVPEIEAIATATLVELEGEGWNVVPSSRAASLTLEREGIRRLAAEELGLPTSPYHFASTLEELREGAAAVGFPCVIKPVMSSSGKGQSVARSADDLERSWQYALEGGRGRQVRVIVEGFIHFDYELTILTVRTRSEGTLFCPPIGHRQERGDYQESWQPHPVSESVLAQCHEIGRKVTEALGGYGLFGVEVFVEGDKVYFSEVSPRPHDTGMVTIATQEMSEFELHVRAVLGLPIRAIRLKAPGASAVVLAPVAGDNPTFSGLAEALVDETVKVRLFGKPEARAYRRMGVVVCQGADAFEARDKAITAAAAIVVTVEPR